MNNVQKREYNSKITNFLAMLEDVNENICKMLNEMYCDSDCELINSDIHLVLNSNLCRGEHLLKGLMEAIDAI